jgi:hypothetical protein
MRALRPNQSGSFSNRTNFHTSDDVKVFTVEFSQETSIEDRLMYIDLISKSTETKEALNRLITAALPHAVPTSTLRMRIDEAKQII